MELFEIQKTYVKNNSFPSISRRKGQLIRLKQWILNHRVNIQKAIYADFAKPFEETDLTEIYNVISEINFALKNLKKWTKFTRVPRTIPLLFHKAYTKFEPKGVVLIISTWNYPFLLSISPLVSALAAGNSVILKPSEFSPHTSKLIYNMVREIFQREKVSVILDDGNTAHELTKLPFDHIYFTGSTMIGKIVAEEAAKNFTSTTLELGGKSPTVVDVSTNLEMAAEKIIWGKFLNTGQSCVAPDYVLVHKQISDEFSNSLVKKLNELYSKTKIEHNGDFGRIISKKHFERLSKLLMNSTSNYSEIIIGGKQNSEDNFIEPTILKLNSIDDNLLEDEIFGPILPLVEYENTTELLELINQKYPPLAIYIFSKDRNFIKLIVENTKSGSVGINDVVIQFSHNHLPFGGVKQSGLGRAHGYEGFKSFSIYRSYIKASSFNFLKIIYPPFTDFKRSIIDFMIKYL